MTEYAIALGVVFAVNLLPAFGPPTWSVLVFFYLTFGLEPAILVPAGALVFGYLGPHGRICLASNEGMIPLLRELDPAARVGAHGPGSSRLMSSCRPAQTGAASPRPSRRGPKQGSSPASTRRTPGQANHDTPRVGSTYQPWSQSSRRPG